MVRDKSVRFEENSEVRLTITVPKEEVRGAYDGIVADYCKKALIPGFRKGKVPPAVLVRKFGDVLLDETQETIVRKSFDEALEGVDKKPLPYSAPYVVDDRERAPAGEVDASLPAAEPGAAPTVEAPKEAAEPTEPAAPPEQEHEHEHLKISLDEDYTFTIAYDAYPDIELGEYRGIEVEKAEYEITEEDVQRELKGLQEQNALVVEKKEGVVEKGNVITISYVELDDAGAEKQQTKREGFSFEVGTGYNLYALDDDLIGLAVAGEKVVEKTFPEDYQHKELAGKSVKVRAQVSSIREKNLPTIDDDLAQDINDKFHTLEDLRKDIRSRLEQTAQSAVRSRMMARILDSLYLSSKVPIPRSMINLQLASNWQTLVSQLRGDERSADRYLESMGRTRRTMLEQWKPDAERRLKSSLIVVTVMDKEKVETTDDDVAARVKEIAERRGSSEQEVRDRVEQEGAMDELKSQIRERKLEDYLLSVATVKPGKKMGFLDLVQGNE